MFYLLSSSGLHTSSTMVPPSAHYRNNNFAYAISHTSDSGRQFYRHFQMLFFVCLFLDSILPLLRKSLSCSATCLTLTTPSSFWVLFCSCHTLTHRGLVFHWNIYGPAPLWKITKVKKGGSRCYILNCLHFYTLYLPLLFQFLTEFWWFCSCYPGYPVALRSTEVNVFLQDLVGANGSFLVMYPDGKINHTWLSEFLKSKDNLSSYSFWQQYLV